MGTLVAPASGAVQRGGISGVLAVDDVNRGARPTEPTFVVVVADPFTAEVDVYGPFDRDGGDAEVERRRRELDAEQLTDVIVVLVPLNPPPRSAPDEKS